MKFPVILVILLTITIAANGQLRKKIKRGRRNKSDNEFALPAHYFQAEWETGHENISSGLSTTVHPNLLLRYGVTDKLDINTEINFLTTRIQINDREKYVTGFEPILIGANYQFTQEHGNLPTIVGSYQLAPPFLATRAYSAYHLGQTLQASAVKTVNKKDQVSVSSGLFWDGFSIHPSYIYGGAYSLSVAKHFSLTANLFGYIGGYAPLHNLDFSFSYQPNDRFQLGLTAGTGLNDAAHNNYVALNGIFGFYTTHHN